MFSYLDVGDWSQIQGLQPPRTLLILPEVSLAADQDHRRVPTEVPHLWMPLDKQDLRNKVFPRLDWLIWLLLFLHHWTITTSMSHATRELKSSQRARLPSIIYWRQTRNSTRVVSQHVLTLHNAWDRRVPWLKHSQSWWGWWRRSRLKPNRLPGKKEASVCRSRPVLRRQKHEVFKHPLNKAFAAKSTFWCTECNTAVGELVETTSWLQLPSLLMELHLFRR